MTRGAPPTLSGLHHVALIVSDIERAAAFYEGILGLREVARSWRAERQSWKLDLELPDGTQLELFTFPGAPARPSRPKALGARHLALRVDELDRWIAHLSGHGVTVEPVRIDPLTGARFTFFADPDGLPLELVGPPAP